MNIIAYRCPGTPTAGGAFFKIPLGLELDTLRLGWAIVVGGGAEDIWFQIRDGDGLVLSTRGSVRDIGW